MIPSIQLTTSIKKTTRLVLGLSLVTNLAVLALPLYSLQIFDRVLTSASLETLWMLFTAVTVLAATAVCFELLRIKVVQKLGQYLDENVFPILISRQRKVEYQEESRQIFADYNHTHKKLVEGSLFTIVDAMMSPLFIITMFLIHPVFGIFALSINLIAAMAVFLKSRWQVPLHAKQQEQRVTEQNKIISHISVLYWLERTSNNEEWQNRRMQAWHDVSNGSSKQYVLSNVISILYSVLKWVAQIGLPTIGTTLLLSSQISIGGFIAGLIIGSKSIIPIEGILLNLASFRRIKIFIDKVKSMIDHEKQGDTAYTAKLQGRIKITDLQLEDQSHSNHRYTALFCMDAKPGEIVAVIGPSGSGQDSIIQSLLTPPSDAEGLVTFDDVRIQDWDNLCLKRQLGFVSSTAVLPEETIRTLITSFDTVAFTDAVSAANLTGLNQRLIELGISYEDILNLDSMKQVSYRSLAQLMVITSALARDPSVYVMENPETFLDIESLGKLRKVLELERSKGKTVLLTTHSKQLLELADTVILLGNGRSTDGEKPGYMTPPDRQSSKTHKIARLASNSA